jgi:hypothetical protein
MQTFNELNPYLLGQFPLTMRYARNIPVSDLPPVPYEPKTQMSIYGGDTMKMMGSKDKSTCSRSSSTGERIRDFGKSDDDRKTDD